MTESTPARRAVLHTNHGDITVELFPDHAPKTVANHVEHIYAKIGVSSRAAATLFASQRGLVGVFEADAG